MTYKEAIIDLVIRWNRNIEIYGSPQHKVEIQAHQTSEEEGYEERVLKVKFRDGILFQENARCSLKDEHREERMYERLFNSITMAGLSSAFITLKDLRRIGDD
jgi:hypothetical protein